METNESQWHSNEELEICVHDRLQVEFYRKVILVPVWYICINMLQDCVV